MKQDWNIHQHDHEDEISPKDIASLRWQAIEAFNTAPGLSPMARRLGTALTTMMDAKTRACFPSELRLSAALGVNRVSINKAKVELRDAGLVNWTNPGGRRHLSRYALNWAALIRLSREASMRADEAMEERKVARRNSSHTATYAAPSNVATGLQKEASKNPREASPNVAISQSQCSQIAPQCSHLATPNVAASLPELSHELSHLELAQQEHDTASGVGLGYAEDELTEARPREDETRNDQKPPPSAGKEALERAQGHPPAVNGCRYPSLMRAFKQSDPEIFAAICKLNGSWQAKASVLLEHNGREAAVEFIRSKAQEIAA